MKIELFLLVPALGRDRCVHSGFSQKAVLNARSRVFAWDDEQGATVQAIHTSSGRIHGTHVEILLQVHAEAEAAER